jgi:hypothetical protein
MPAAGRRRAGRRSKAHCFMDTAFPGGWILDSCQAAGYRSCHGRAGAAESEGDGSERRVCKSWLDGNSDVPDRFAGAGGLWG